MMYDFFSLWTRLPKKYRDRIRDFYAADDLIGDCQYMLELQNPWTWNGYPTVPVRNLSEAIQFVKETYVDRDAWWFEKGV